MVQLLVDWFLDRNPREVRTRVARVIFLQIVLPEINRLIINS